MKTMTIGRRITGIVAVLLAITIVLVSTLLLKLVEFGGRIALTSEVLVPVSRALDDLNESGLRRRLAFERWQGALLAPKPDPLVLQEASANYQIFTAKIEEGFERSASLLRATKGNRDLEAEVADIERLLRLVRAEYETVQMRNDEVLRLRRERKHPAAGVALRDLASLQARLQERRSEARDAIWSILERYAKSTRSQESTLVVVGVLALIASILLGIALSGQQAKQITVPVAALKEGLAAVEGGDIERTLPILSDDEVGDLTRSFNFFVEGLREKERIRGVFGRYVDPRVIERLLASSDMSKLETTLGQKSVSFCDLAGFTGLSERLNPSQLVSSLNHHFSLQTEAIQASGGVVDKFLGDEVLAFWGTPFCHVGEEARLACQSALAQLDAFRRFSLELEGLGTGGTGIGIGIATGDVITGSIGSETSRSFTVIGDKVNLASRLQQLNRVYGTQIIVDEATVQGAGPGFAFRELDLVVVKGQTLPNRIYEMLGMAASVTEEQQRYMQAYALLLAAYRRADWPEALRLVEDCCRLRPDDQAVAVLAERINDFEINPPGPDWDGAHVMQTK